MRNPDFLNSGFRNSTSAFWSLFPDYNPVSALQNTILLFCNLFCIVIAQNNYSLPCFFCSKNKCCSLNLGNISQRGICFSQRGGAHLCTEEAITTNHSLFLCQLLQSLLWLKSPLHHAGSLLALITAHCCQHLPSQVVMTSAEGHLALIKNKGYFYEPAHLQWYSNNCQKV